MKTEVGIFRILKYILSTIKTKENGQRVLRIATIGTAGGTLLLALTSFLSTRVAIENTKLTREMEESSQRPLLFWDLKGNYTIRRLPDDPKRLEIDSVWWYNTGKGPALKIRKWEVIDNQKAPHCDTINYFLNSNTSFVVWPNQVIPDRFRPAIDAPFDSFCTRYLHVGVWYKDRNNINYLEEYVWWVKIVNFQITQMDVDGYFTYNWQGKKWE